MKRREALKTSALLAGCGLSIGTISAIMTGCKTDSAAPVAAGQLSDGQKALIAEVSELIIPETDTPGAKSAGVPEDIYAHLQANFTAEDREKMISGLATFDTKANEIAGGQFMSLDRSKQEEVLTAIAKDGGEDNIFDMLKGVTTYLFFTSEKGAKEVLVYDPIPGGYQGCIDVSEVGGLWAL